MFRRMRGQDAQQSTAFSYLSPEDRVPADHPLRRMRPMVDAALKALSPTFDEMYSKVGRPSIAPEKLLKALLLQVLYTIRSERMLMEQMSYNLLFRWFVGLNMDDAVWVPTVYSKNRDPWFANIRSPRNGLTVSGMGGKNRRHGGSFPVDVSICPIAPQRPSSRGHRERRAANANRSLSAKAE